MDQGRRVYLGISARVSFHNHSILVMPQMAGIVVVGEPLAVVSKKLIETQKIWIAFGAGIPQAPFTESPGGISRFLE